MFIDVLESRLLMASAVNVRGQVFVDADENGVRSRGEAGLAGVTVYVDADGDGTRGPGDVAVQTSRGGAYAFGGLAPGNYVVRVEVPEAAAARRFDAAAVTVGAAGRAARARPIGLVGTGEIRGSVTRIEALSYQQPIGPAKRFHVFVVGRADATGRTVRRLAKTDVNGLYAVTGLFVGRYDVFVRQRGWRSTTGTFHAAVGNGFSIRDFVPFHVYFTGHQ